MLDVALDGKYTLTCFSKHSGLEVAGHSEIYPPSQNTEFVPKL